MTDDTKTHLATLSILVKEREAHSAKVNEILSRHGDRILARLGVNLERSGVRNGSGLIEVVLEGTLADITTLAGELDSLYGIVAKTSILD